MAIIWPLKRRPPRFAIARRGKMSVETWTVAELRQFEKTGKEPGAQGAGKGRPKASRRTQPKRSAEAPLSCKGAYAIFMSTL